MTPGSQPHKKRNSSKVNLTISLVFHGLIVAALVYFAAREGLLGKELKKLAVTMVKEKPPEKPKEEKPKEEPPKIETPKVAITPKIEPPKEVVAPPATAVAPPAVAPPPDVQSFFDGGKLVKTESDPVDMYKNVVQSSLLARWNRPDGMDDANFVAEVDVTVSPDGELSNPVWKKSSGNKKWDDSVNQAIAAAKSIPTAPPPKFPSHITVRFDVAQPEGGALSGLQ